MNHLVKSERDIELLRESGKRLAAVRDSIASHVAPGVSTKELDDLARKLIEANGDKASFLNYSPEGAERPFPAAVCISVNDEIVHGIPNENPKTLKEGDIVGIDLGVTHKGLITDSAVTVPVGKSDGKIEELLSVTKKSLEEGIKAARGGARVGDIGYAIESFVDGRYGIVEELGGHGVGWQVHEDPSIPNFGAKGTGEELVPGMVIAIEPMLNIGTKNIKLGADGYTFLTADGSMSAHFEHTLLITEGEPEVLTRSN
jgi:methionyl aminopeptidase